MIRGFGDHSLTPPGHIVHEDVWRPQATGPGPRWTYRNRSASFKLSLCVPWLACLEVTRTGPVQNWRRIIKGDCHRFQGNPMPFDRYMTLLRVGQVTLNSRIDWNPKHSWASTAVGKSWSLEELAHPVQIAIVFLGFAIDLILVLPHVG